MRVQYCGNCPFIEKKALEIKSLVKDINCDVEFVKDKDPTGNLKVTLGKFIIFDKKKTGGCPQKDTKSFLSNITKTI